MLYDIAIVGGGPAGCSAAVTAANRSLGTLLLDTGDFGLARESGMTGKKTGRFLLALAVLGMLAGGCV